MTSMSLPSIHEMFPDHLMKSDSRPRPHSSSLEYRSLPPRSAPNVPSSSAERSSRLHPRLSAPGSQPVTKFHPRSESSTAPYSYPYDPHPPPFGIDASRIQGHSQGPDYRTRRSSDNSHPQLSNRSFPYNAHGVNGLEPDYEDDDCPSGQSMASADGSFLANNLDALGRKHVCPTCFKRFNRPSSLRIHLNTHTGATPFKCPWSTCGRQFNVNSNMRRHYRNHLGAPRGQGQFPPVHVSNELRPLAPATMHSTHHDAPRLRHNADSPRESLSPSPSQASSTGSRASSPTGTDHHSSERSPKPRYSASKPYSASLSDARVRTTLRPAFARGT